MSTVLEYHVRIKILKKEALSLADISIPLYRYPSMKTRSTSSD